MQGRCTTIKWQQQHRSSWDGASAGALPRLSPVPGQNYQVSFDVAGNYGGPLAVKPLTVTVVGVTPSAIQALKRMNWAHAASGGQPHPATRGQPDSRQA